MKQWIRWSGLLGFIAVTALLVVIFVVALPWLIKSSIESIGTKMAGAKVSVDDVDVSFNPLGVRLNRLQVADAREPMRNLVEFTQADAQLELAPLLLGKGIVRELGVSNLQFNTERSDSGAIAKPTPEERAAEAAKKVAKEPLFRAEDLPSADEIFAREPLKTTAAGEAMEATYKQRKADVEAAVASVPTQADLTKYETELKALTNGRFSSLEDFKQGKAKLDELKKRFKADQVAIQQARDVIQASRKDIELAVANLKNAPSEDLAYLRDKYQLNASGAANMTGLLLGDQVAEWASQALYWYELISPYLAADGEAKPEVIEASRLSGRFIHFSSNDPWPEFLIRNAHITGPFDGGNLVINGHDLTHQQNVTQRPSVLTITGNQLQRVGDLNSVITLDHRQQPAIDSATLTISDGRLAPVNLGIAGAELVSSRVQVKAGAKVVAGKLTATADAIVLDAKFSGAGKTTFAREMNQALANITQFTVNAGAKGDLLTPKIEFGSDLDKQLSKAFNQRIRAKQDELEAKLRTRLTAQVAQYGGDYAAELQQLAAMDGSMNDRFNVLKDMASQQLEDFTVQKEREAQAKLDAEKDAAKAEADRIKKEAEQRAKDKLKKLF
jgi:uncharacterized protein (TIGR03545 family)